MLAIGAADAADIPRKAVAPVARPVCAAAQFQGVYVGISGGAVYHEAHRLDSDALLTHHSGWTLSKFGGIAGAQAGYNWTTCNTVWGIEVDGSWVGVKNTFHENPQDEVDNFITTKVNALFTARLRTGVVLDSLLLYVTGGVAGARILTTWADIDGDGSAEFKEWRWGWTAGFGTEWAWTPNLSLKSEVLFVAFADRDRTAIIGPPISSPDTFSFRHQDSLWVARVGLNYRWGVADPVVARF